MEKNEILRLSKIIDAIMEVANGNLSVNIELTENKDEIDSLAVGLNMMINDLKFNINEIKKQRNWFSSTLLSISDAVVTVNTEGKITLCNPAAERITNWKTAEILNNKIEAIFNVIDEKNNNFMSNPVLDILNKKKLYSSTNLYVLETKYKNRIPIDYTVLPIFNEENDLLGAVLTFRDISAQKNKEKELIKAKEQAEASNKAKREFLAVVSHELRTPMTGIMGYTRLLLNQEKDPSKREFLRIINESGENLLNIMNDLLDIAKIESGKLDIINHAINIEFLLEEIINFFSLSAEEKGITLLSELNTDVVTIIGDINRLRQILINIVGNALKFTNEGQVKICIEKTRSDQKTISLKFSIIDTGIGIPENKIPLLFNNFSQIDSSTTRKYGGVGLGLAISKRLINLMGGTINVESKGGKGSNFFFEVPFIIPEENMVKPGESNAAVNLHDLNILFIEDDPMISNFLQTLFTEIDTVLDILIDGEYVLNKLHENDFDLILMDIQMPEIDGITLTKKIREAGINIPIIALTAHAMKGDKEECLNAGMNDFLSKPINNKLLFETIGKYIN